MSLIQRPIATASLIVITGIATSVIFSNSYLLFLGLLGGIGYLWYRLDLPTSSAQDGQSLDPEVVRDRTVQWSEPDYDESTRQQLAPHLAHQDTLSASGRKSPTQSNSKDKPTSDDGGASHGDTGELSDLQYRWETESDVSFEDVGGLNDVKEELRRDVIRPLTSHKEQAEKLDIYPANIVFHGPPGTGKTYLARALATELKFPFVTLSGANVQSKWINESTQKVQTLFDEARQIAAEEGGAVVFLDELDAVLKSRSNQRAHEEDSKVVNEFLNHLETTSEQNVVFIGATNRLESLDEAGIRPGRIELKIHIGLPDQYTRTEILRAQLADRPHALYDDHIEQVACWTQGKSAAQLAEIVDEAARSCLDRGDDQIKWPDIRRVVSP